MSSNENNKGYTEGNIVLLIVYVQKHQMTYFIGSAMKTIN